MFSGSKEFFFFENTLLSRRKAWFLHCTWINFAEVETTIEKNRLNGGYPVFENKTMNSERISPHWRGGRKAWFLRSTGIKGVAASSHSSHKIGLSTTSSRGL